MGDKPKSLNFDTLTPVEIDKSLTFLVNWAKEQEFGDLMVYYSSTSRKKCDIDPELTGKLQLLVKLASYVGESGCL